MRKFVLLLGCFVASPVAAGEAKLSGEAIKATLGGSLLALDTPVGSTVSVRIGHDGIMSGEAGTALGAVLGATKDRGRWWVTDDKVCFKWFRWFDAEQRCATISVEGKRFTWHRDDGDTGTGTIVESGTPLSKPEVVVAEAKKPVAIAHKQSERKPEVVVAATDLKANMAPRVETKPPLAHSKPAATMKRIEEATVATVLHVPAPRPAMRPKHDDPIAVASVKPQFFASAKVTTAKIQHAKVEIAKAHPARSVAQTADHKPFRVAGVDPSDVLNIRTGPSPDYETVGGIPSNSHGITITGPCQNDWCPVRHQTLVGWVNRRYLTEETASNTAAVSELNYWDQTP